MNWLQCYTLLIVLITMGIALPSVARRAALAQAPKAKEVLAARLASMRLKEVAGTTGRGATGSRADAYLNLLAKAKAEGKVVMSDSGDPLIFAKVTKAFEKYFGFSVDLKLVQARGRNMNKQYSTAAEAGRHLWDIAGAGPTNQTGALEHGDLMQHKFAELGLYDQFSDLQGWVNHPTLSTRVRPYCTYRTSSFRALVYDPTRLPPGGAPRTLEELTDPKWKGLVMTGTSASGMDLLTEAPGWNGEKVVQWHRDMVANDIVVVKGSAASLDLNILNGEAIIGIGEPTRAEKLKRQGAPMDWLFPLGPGGKPIIMVVPSGGCLFGDGKKGNPNMARLFQAFYLTEGLREFGWELGIIKVGESETNPLVQEFRKRGYSLNAKDWIFHDPDDRKAYDASRNWRKKAQEILAGIAK